MALKIFIIMVFLIIYPLFLYPILLTLLARFHPEPVRKSIPGIWPKITMIIPVHNEENIIEEKIKNTLSLRYPEDCLEILVASDGSNDRTIEILNTFQKETFKIIDFKIRRGKLLTIIDVVKYSTGDILVFSDASAILEEEALIRLVENFSDKSVGCVSGRYLIQGDISAPHDARSFGEKGYFEFEVYLRKRESEFHSTLGAHGALYGLRRELFPEVPTGIINDDFVIPMMALSQGFRTVYEERAIVVERHQTNLKGELRRRIRISHGNFQQIFLLVPMLGFRDLKAQFVFLSHKVIRAFQPVYLMMIFVTSLILKGPFFKAFVEFQIGFYILGIASLFTKRPKKVFAIPLYFVLVNVAIVAGFIKQIKQGRKQAVLKWEKS